MPWALRNFAMGMCGAAVVSAVIGRWRWCVALMIGAGVALGVAEALGRVTDRDGDEINWVAQAMLNPGRYVAWCRKTMPFRWSASDLDNVHGYLRDVTGVDFRDYADGEQSEAVDEAV